MAIHLRITPEQRLHKAVAFLLNYDGLEAMAGLLMIGKRTIVDNLPSGTCATDGINSWYDTRFMDAVNDPVLRFAIIHEEFHKMFRHFRTWRHLWEIDPQLANMSADYVINLMINDIAKDSNGEIELCEGALIDEAYRGMSAQQVFNELRKKQQEQNGGSGGGQPGDGQPQPGDGGGQPGEGDGNMPDFSQGGMDDHNWTATEEMTADQAREIEQQIDEAIRQGTMLAAAKGVGNQLVDIDELLEPKVNWRDALRDFVSAHCRGADLSTFRRPKRRYIGAGLYLPSTYSERVDEVMDANDVSGSTMHMQQEFRSEIQAIVDQVKPKTLHHIDWDTTVQTHEIIEEGKEGDILKLKAHGGGGTSVECVSTYLQEKKLAPTVLIILTDGYLSGGWGHWPSDTNVLWCIFDNPGATPDCGSVIHIRSEDV